MHISVNMHTTAVSSGAESLKKGTKQHLIMKPTHTCNKDSEVLVMGS